jgi:hypothetical protein
MILLYTVQRVWIDMKTTKSSGIGSKDTPQL